MDVTIAQSILTWARIVLICVFMNFAILFKLIESFCNGFWSAAQAALLNFAKLMPAPSLTNPRWFYLYNRGG